MALALAQALRLQRAQYESAKGLIWLLKKSDIRLIRLQMNRLRTQAPLIPSGA